MNKIERAIYDTKLQISNLEREILILNSKLNAYKDQLETLEVIQNNKHIKHE
jgi:hypothetical protein